MMSSIMEMMPSIDMSTILALALIIIPVAVVLALLFARRSLSTPFHKYGDAFF